MSGVWVWAWMARNWERREETSGGERPAERRRSKPRGAGVVEEVLVVCNPAIVGSVAGLVLLLLLLLSLSFDAS